MRKFQSPKPFKSGRFLIKYSMLARVKFESILLKLVQPTAEIGRFFARFASD